MYATPLFKDYACASNAIYKMCCYKQNFKCLHYNTRYRKPCFIELSALIETLFYQINKIFAIRAYALIRIAHTFTLFSVPDHINTIYINKVEDSCSLLFVKSFYADLRVF